MSATTAYNAEPDGRVLWMTKKERAIFAEFAACDFDAWMTPDQAARIEAGAISPKNTAMRRIAVELLTRSKSELLADLTETGAITMIQAAGDAKKLSELMTRDEALQAQVRMFVTVATYNAQQRAARFTGPRADGSGI